MTTAALLPTPGDVHVARYWLRNYATWRDEVDRLEVLVNGSDPWEATGLFRAAGASVNVVTRRIGHGEALNALLANTSAETVLLIEDDAYVREPGAIRSRLERAEAGEIIASPRGGMSPELERASLEKWGPVTGPDTSTGHGLWPCFLFAQARALRQPVGFQGYRWLPGQTIPGLDYRPTQDCDTDTATALAYMLRAQYPITLDVQHKELWQKELPAAGAPYFHAGGFSNLDQMPREGCGGSNEGLDWAHRIWWWRRVGVDPARLAEMVRVGNLAEQLEAWAPILEPWITWPE